MSGAKDLLAHIENQHDVALQTAIAANVLRVCEYHGEAFDGGGERTPAYKLGMWKFKRGKLNHLFANERELMDAIKAAIEDHPSDCCPRCENYD